MSGHVLLIGFMGSGKSTVGRLLADRLAQPFVDLDERIEQRAGATVAELFECEGEEAFRRLESEALESLVEEEASVVACGGGVVTREGNVDQLARLGTVVYLSVAAEDALARIGDPSSRPLLQPDPERAADELLAARSYLYERSADIIVDTTSAPPARVADLIEAALEGETRA